VLVTDTGGSVGRSLVSRYKQVKRDQSSGNESMRIVRTALLARLNGQDSTALLITSTAAGTGKSHFTMMLGESLARVGKKVLVIDADLRKMTLTKRLNLCGNPGFIQSLPVGSVHKRHIMQSKVPGLSFLPAGCVSSTTSYCWTVHRFYRRRMQQYSQARWMVRLWSSESLYRSARIRSMRLPVWRPAEDTL